MSENIFTGHMQINEKTSPSPYSHRQHTEPGYPSPGIPNPVMSDRTTSETIVSGNRSPAMVDFAGTARILVVDDDPIICDVIRDVLEPAYEITVALNAQDATKIIQNGSLDLLIMDYHLPGCDGKQLYDWIVSNYPSLRHHIVFSTGDICDEGIRRFVESTGCPCLYKPFSNSNLRHTVSALLSA